MSSDDKPNRQSTRLRGFDYTSAGTYFITICAHQRECLFGEIINGQVQLNRFGAIVASAWSDLPKHYTHVALDQFAIMPNHVHGIIKLRDVGAVGTQWAGCKPALDAGGTRAVKSHGLPEIVRAFKTFSARRINQQRNTPGTPVWQRNYHDHIIRNGNSLQKIREYIQNNPLKWELDKNNPDIFRKSGRV